MSHVEPLEPRRLLSNRFIGDVVPISADPTGVGDSLGISPTVSGYVSGYVGQVDPTRAQFDFLLRPLGADGTPAGPAVDTGITSPFATVSGPNFATDAAGNASVVWGAESGESQNPTLYLRRFDASGVPLGPAVVLNPASIGPLNRSPSVAVNARGEIAVAWYRGNGRQSDQIYLRRYAADGAPLTGAVVAYGGSPDSLGLDAPAIALAPDGTATVAWQESFNLPGTSVFASESRILAARFDAGGNRLGAVLEASQTYADPYSTYPVTNFSPDVAVAPDGTATLAWLRHGGGDPPDSGSAHTVWMRSFDAAGLPLSDEAQVSSSWTDYAPRVGVDGAGRAVVSWSDTTVNQPNPVVYARQMTVKGVPLGSEFIASPVSQGSDRPSAVLARPDGQFLVGWSGPGERDGRFVSQVFAQSFDQAGTSPAPSALGAAVEYRPIYGIEGAAPAIRVRFDEPLAESFRPDDLTLTNLTTGQTILSAYLLTLELPTKGNLGGGDVGGAAASAPAADAVVGPYVPKTAGSLYPRLALPDGNWRLTIKHEGVGDDQGNFLASDFHYDFSLLTGDANGDRSVNLSDFQILLSQYGHKVDAGAGGDLNHDGKVDGADFQVLLANYGRHLPDPSIAGAASAPAGVTARVPTGGGRGTIAPRRRTAFGAVLLPALQPATRGAISVRRAVFGETPIVTPSAVDLVDGEDAAG